ncbi:MAG: squalene/phytoene synthase family protein [Chloroflexota bacterium]
MNTTAALARSLTWASSKQSYLTARLLADRDLSDDCLRAYAYFRWADDFIDITCQSCEERTSFLRRQQDIIESLYRGEWPVDLCPEEQMLADLIAHDRGPDSGLRSFIHNFMSVIAFDAARCGHLVNQSELATYTTNLATAVMDGLLYFIANGHSYPQSSKRTLAVVGAHLTHMLRDTLEDLPRGIVNIPTEDIAEYDLNPDDTQSDAFRRWTRAQVEEARRCLREGMTYIDSLDVLRAKLAGVWYCARFECILTAIERDNFILRLEYPERHCLAVWMRMVGLGMVVTLKHVYGQTRLALSRFVRRFKLGQEANIPSYPS